jgi:serine protease SohB
MIDFWMHYSLFLLKSVTIVIAIVVVIAFATFSARRGKPTQRLEVEDLNKKYDALARALKKQVLTKKAFAAAEKDRKRMQRKGEGPKRRLFVINFHGDIKATGVSSLREEITAVLTLATPEDEVLIRLENAGGLVHEHGLAASQLARIKEQGIPLTVAVDKVAASGGYMMACVADRIIGAPFAIIGSIGVLAQLPNFHRLLDKHGVDFEQFKAGELKRTVTMFGENTEKERARLQEQLEDVHGLFKSFVKQNRPTVDLEQVATGEYWYGSRALERKLIDELRTSDDYLLEASSSANLYRISYTTKKTLGERLASAIGSVVDRILLGR